MKKVLIAILLLGLLPHASADYIHWVDFRLSAPVLRSALELDMASQGGEQPLDWIDILALAAAWRGGTGVTVADTQRAAQALRGDTPPERESAALAADKVLRRMRVDIMTGFMEPDEEFDLQVRILNEDYDVQLSKKQTDKFRRLFMDLYLQSSLWQLGGWTAVSLFYSGAAYGPERRPTSEKVRKATPPDADKLAELLEGLGPDWSKLPKS